MATAGLASWIYATVCWTASAATRGTEVIDEMVEAVKQSISRTVAVTSVWADVLEDLAEVARRLVLRGGWIGERVFDILARIIDKVFTQAGDVACYLVVIVAAVIGTSIICEYYRRRGPAEAPGALPPQETAAAALRAAEDRAPRNDFWRPNLGSEQAGTAWKLDCQKMRGLIVPYVSSARRFLQPYLGARIEVYERRSCNIAFVVGGELPHPRVTSQSHELYGASKMTLNGLLDYTNEGDRRRLTDWLEGDKGRCRWNGLAVCYSEDGRGEWIRIGEVERPRSFVDRDGADALPNIEVWKVTGPKR